MFTLADLDRARTKGRSAILDSILFSIEKNEFAYAMNLCHSHDRGTYAERLVCNRLTDLGFDVKLIGGTGEYDLLFENQIKIEVKLGTIQPSGKKNTKYIFHKIKPELFDIIFLVFLNPNGAVIKWTTSEMFSEWSVGYKRGKHGYSISFNHEMKSKELVYNESIDSFIRLHS